MLTQISEDKIFMHVSVVSTLKKHLFSFDVKNGSHGFFLTKGEKLSRSVFHTYCLLHYTQITIVKEGFLFVHQALKKFSRWFKEKKVFSSESFFFVCLLVDLILWCQFSGLQSNKKASLRKHSFFHYLLQIEINRLSVHYFIKRNKKKGTEK